MTHENTADVDARIRAIIATCVQGLDEQDRAARIAWCQQTGKHGVRAKMTGDDLELVWGGLRLALIPAAALQDPTAVLDWQRVPFAPDDASALDTP